MTTRIVIALLILLGLPAEAAIIPIRSGDHTSFTRLVFTIPPGRDWKLGRTTTGYRLYTGDPGDSFDSTGVFERLPSSRLAGLEPGRAAGVLEIAVTCDCYADAFLWRADGLVIDIRDGAAPSDSVFEMPFDMQVIAPYTSTINPLPLLTADPLLLMPQTSAPDIIMPAEQTVTSPEHNRIIEAEQAIGDSFARAGEQGLLHTAQRIEAIPSFDPVPPVAIADQRRPGITARTSFERDFSGLSTSVLTNATGTTCLEDHYFALSDWADDRPFPVQHAAAFAALTTEFDQYPEGAIEALARLYIHFGFGREARAVLMLDGQHSREREILIALAYLVDEEPAPSGIFADQVGCTKAVAFWAALAVNSLDGMDESARSAAIMAFRTLPEPLRGHLGARLARLMVSAGDPVSAEALLSAATIHLDSPLISAELTAAEITLQTAGPNPAIAVLEDMATGDPRLTPDGITRLIELTLREGRQVDPAIISLAETMRGEYRAATEGADLAAALIRAYIAADNFAKAMELIAADLSPMTPKVLLQLRSETLIAAAGRMPDAGFLDLAFGPEPGGFSPAAGNAMARRLLDLGFAERAARLLSEPATGPDMAERRYLRAETAIAMGNVSAVAEMLTGMDDARAAQLRALAQANQGASEASAALTAMSDDISDPAPALPAGAWQALETTDDPLLRAASDMIHAVPTALPDVQPLAERHRLLDEAEQTRILAHQLLERFTLDPVEGMDPDPPSGAPMN